LVNILFGLALGQVVLVYFAVGGAAGTAQDTQPGRATFAEMIAFARLAFVACQRLAPDADSFHAVALELSPNLGDGRGQAAAG
jgi:hypothetical protein